MLMFRIEIRVVKCLHLLIPKKDRYCKSKKEKKKKNKFHGRCISIRNHKSNAKSNKADKYINDHLEWKKMHIKLATEHAIILTVL